jgi:hypothetical protein
MEKNSEEKNIYLKNFNKILQKKKKKKFFFSSETQLKILFK